MNSSSVLKRSTTIINIANGSKQYSSGQANSRSRYLSRIRTGLRLGKGPRSREKKAAGGSVLQLVHGARDALGVGHQVQDAQNITRALATVRLHAFVVQARQLVEVDGFLAVPQDIGDDQRRSHQREEVPTIHRPADFRMVIEQHGHQPRALAVEKTEFVRDAREDLLERNGRPGRVQNLQDLLLDVVQHVSRQNGKIVITERDPLQRLTHQQQHAPGLVSAQHRILRPFPQFGGRHDTTAGKDAVGPVNLLALADGTGQVRTQGRDGGLLDLPHALARNANAHPGNLLQRAPLHVRSEQRVGQPVALFDYEDLLGVEELPQPSAGVGQLGVARLKAARPVEEPADVFERRGAKVRQVEKLLVTPTTKLADGLHARLLETVYDARTQTRFGNEPAVDLLARKLMWLNSLHNRLQIDYTCPPVNEYVNT